MLSNRIEEFWTEHRKKFIVGSLVLLALIWVYYGVYVQYAPIEETILFIVLFISASIELITDEVLELREELKTPPEMHETSVSTIEPLKDLLREENPMAVYLLEYNSTSVEELLDAAIEHNCDIYLLIKDPRSSRNESQKSNIRSQLTTHYEKHYDYDNLTIHFYSKPSSLKARMLDEHMICSGWYTFDDRGINRDKQVWGKDNPMMCISKEKNPEYFKSYMSWFKDVYFDLWTSGLSFHDLYQDGQYTDLREEGVISEEWIEQVSGSTEIEKEELFRQ